MPNVEDEHFLVWFGDRFAYSIAQEDSHYLLEDIKNKNVAGMMHYINRYTQ